MSAIYLLTLRQLTSRTRFVVMTVLASLPVLVAVVTIRSSSAPTVSGFETSVLNTMLVGAILPLVALATATTAFSHELEDRTLANLALTPIPRWQIALPKLLAASSVALPFMAGSAFLTAFIGFHGDPRAVLAVTGAVALGLLLYSAAFVWIGLVATHAIGVGLLYVVLWEGFFSSFVDGVRALSIRHYAIGFMHGLDPRRFAGTDVFGFPSTVAVSLAILGGFLLLTVRRLRRMDVP